MSSSTKPAPKKKPMSKPAPQAEMTMDEILASKTPVVTSVPVQINGQVALEISKLQDELRQAREFDAGSNKPDTAPKVIRALQAAIDRGEATIRIFKFRSIGRARFDDLMKKFPPTPEQKKAGEQIDAAKLAPHLIAEASFEPKISLDQSLAMHESEDWNQSELLTLFFGALSANNETPDIPLSNIGSRSMGGSLSSLVSLLSGESPSPST